jgi:Dullard-like phosphatase family protein
METLEQTETISKVSLSSFDTEDSIFKKEKEKNKPNNNSDIKEQNLLSKKKDETNMKEDSNPKLNLMKDRSPFESLKFDFVESSLNCKNNYQSYVSKVLKSITKFKNMSFIKEISKRRVNLPNTQKKHTLILDLDETLIHSKFEHENVENLDEENLNYSDAASRVTPSKEKENINPEKENSSSLEIVNLSFYDKEIDEEVKFKVYLRPGVRDFLKIVSKDFQVGVFTASTQEYADAVLKFLDPNNEIFEFKLYRDSCIKLGRAYIKDLRIIKNRCLENVVLLDNNLYSFCNQLSNGILIYSFYDDHKDQELLSIQSYLTEYLAKCNDVKYVNDQVFNFQSILDEFL